MTRTLRAISPVVATALLIIIAVVTAVVLYTWVNGMVGSQPTQQTKLQKAIRIEGVKVAQYDSTLLNLTNVYVRNIGDSPVKVSAVYIIDPRTGQTLNMTELGTPQSIDPGDLADISINNGQGITVSNPPDTVLIKVTTTDGIEATYLLTRA